MVEVTTKFAWSDSQIPKENLDHKQTLFRTRLAQISVLNDYNSTDRTFTSLCHSGEVPITILSRFHLMKRHKLLMRPLAVY